MQEPVRKVVENGDLGKSTIMPEVTIHVPMPRGAAVPAPAPSQPARTPRPQGEADRTNGERSR